MVKKSNEQRVTSSEGESSSHRSLLIARYSRRSGQGTTEFVLMLAVLTAIGIYFMHSFVGPHGQTGAINNAQSGVITKIANDPN